MRFAVLGANGQLGADICLTAREAGDEVIELTHDLVDVRDLDRLREIMTEVRPAVVVNAAAFHHVERCEEDPLTAFGVNALGARNAAIVADEREALLVQVSTDYVFDGTKRTPYIETDRPLPLNVYGNSKLAGELFARTLCRRHVVVRLSALYGQHPCRGKGLNFVDRMLTLSARHDEIRVVTDEVVSPTATLDAARQVLLVVHHGYEGLCHATAEGWCSWFEFAEEILRVAGTRARAVPAAPGEFPVKTSRPPYSVLENASLKKHGINVMRPWQEGVRGYLRAWNGT